MIPWYKDSQTYGSYWKMGYGEYPYTVYFYEKEGDATSCKEKFPIKRKDGSLFTKDDLCKKIESAMNIFNEADFGLKFTFKEHKTTEFDNTAFDMSDGKSAIVVYWNHPDWAGLSAPFSQTQVGMKISIGENVANDGVDGIIKHEMEHVLGFAHKESVFGDYLDWRDADFVCKPERPGGLPFDTLHGLDTVYNVYPDYLVCGRVRGYDLRQHAQAYLIDVRTEKPLYQTPIDKVGYYEFRLRRYLKVWKLLVIAKTDTGIYYNNSAATCMAMKPDKRLYCQQSVRLDAKVDSFELVEAFNKINIKGK